MEQQELTSGTGIDKWNQEKEKFNFILHMKRVQLYELMEKHNYKKIHSDSINSIFVLKI